MQRPVEVEIIPVTRVRRRQAPRRGARSRPVTARTALRTRGKVIAGLFIALVASAHLAGMGLAGSRASAVSATPRSWLTSTTLLTVYGRSFGTAPILGRLGMDHSFADVARQVRPYVHAIHRYGGARHVRIAIHLIYGLATPCTSETTCLLYLDDDGVNIVKRYIEPAARRGWLVILDDQLGRSSPYSEIERMIARGYLRYDNVEVAFDPEFHATVGQALPGVPPGFVTAEGLNLAQRTLSRYAASRHLAHRKLMLVHQWTSAMIRHRRKLDHRIAYVDPVLIMDAFGAPAAKVRAYDHLLGPGHAAGVRWRGIKLFPPNPYEMAGHLDDPILSWRQVFGLDGTGTGPDSYVHPIPNVIVMT
jgi:hypothetical protein